MKTKKILIGLVLLLVLFSGCTELPFLDGSLKMQAQDRDIELTLTSFLTWGILFLILGVISLVFGKIFGAGGIIVGVIFLLIYFLPFVG